MSLGLFDVLGPVMHGPSSNHTGGANRIGYLARKIMGEEPHSVTLLFHPKYMKSYESQHSHIALMAGCLGCREYEEECNDSLEIASQKGITWKATAITDIPEEGLSRNTMRIAAKTKADGRERYYDINGDSVGGGSIVIRHINGVETALTGNEYLALFFGDEGAAKKAAAATEDVSPAEKRWEGNGSDGRYFICMASKKKAFVLPTGSQFCSVEMRMVEPLYPFRDAGDKPLLESFAQLLKYAEETGNTMDQIAVEYEKVHSNQTEDKIREEGRFLVSVIRDSLKKGEEERLRFLAGIADPSDPEKLYKLAAENRGSVSPEFSRALGRAMILAGQNAAAGRIVACPTGGAAGCLPAVLLTAAEQYQASEEKLASAFLVAALIGSIIGYKASFSGTVGGCQAEVGIGAAMGAGATAFLGGGNTRQIVEAAVIAMKNMLGLSCDPPTAATEVPCIKRNAMGVSVAFFGADMGLAGIGSAISPDDVITALADTQKRLPTEIKFGGRGGLAGTESAKELRKKLGVTE